LEQGTSALAKDLALGLKRGRVNLSIVRMFPAGCKAFSLANGKGTGTNDWVIKSLD
jgi:hypothetical protein